MVNPTVYPLYPGASADYSSPPCCVSVCIGRMGSELQIPRPGPVSSPLCSSVARNDTCWPSGGLHGPDTITAAVRGPPDGLRRVSDSCFTVPFWFIKHKSTAWTTIYAAKSDEDRLDYQPGANPPDPQGSQALVISLIKLRKQLKTKTVRLLHCYPI